MDRLNARKRVIGNRRRGAGRISRGTRPRRLALESLEDRTLLAVYTPTLFTDGVTGGTATLATASSRPTPIPVPPSA